MTVHSNDWLVPDIDYILDDQLVKGMFFSGQRSAFHAELSPSMQSIFAACHIMKIKQSRVALFPIPVIDFFPSGAFSNERFRDQFMNVTGFFYTIFAQANRRVRTWTLRIVTSKHCAFGAPSRAAENIAKLIDLVQTFVTSNVTGFHKHIVAGVL